LRGWEKSFPDHRYTANELRIGATARILTLIQLILGDERLSYDLDKQITSLYEVEVIFNADLRG